MKTYADTLDEQIAVAATIIKANSGIIVSGNTIPPETIAAAIIAADSYFFSEDFLDLVDVAAQSVPADESLYVSDFPSISGWISFERDVDWSAVEAMSRWAIDAPRDALAENQAISQAMLSHISSLYFEAYGEFFSCTPFSHGTQIAGFYGRLPANMEHPHSQWLKASMLLLSQPGVANISTELPPRAYRKRAERNHVTPTVRVIRLPRHTRADSPPPTPMNVDWQSRWIVSGHWRKQPWGPERKRIRPVWIAPYVKGPEDKPLKPQAHRLFVASAPDSNATANAT